MVYRSIFILGSEVNIKAAQVFIERFAGEALALLLPDDDRRLINIAHTGCHMKYKKVKTV